MRATGCERRESHGVRTSGCERGESHGVNTVTRQLQIPNTKYTRDTGQTRNKLLEQWVHLTNHTAGHSRPGTTPRGVY